MCNFYDVHELMIKAPKKFRTRKFTTSHCTTRHRLAFAWFLKSFLCGCVCIPHGYQASGKAD